jgi:hypothetical protein
VESCSPAAFPSVLGAPMIELFLILLRVNLNLFPTSSLFDMEMLALIESCSPDLMNVAEIPLLLRGSHTGL